MSLSPCFSFRPYTHFHFTRAGAILSLARTALAGEVKTIELPSTNIPSPVMLTDVTDLVSQPNLYTLCVAGTQGEITLFTLG